MAPSKPRHQPVFADVLKKYFKHVVRELFPDPEVGDLLEKTIRNYVLNLQREQMTEEKIYLLLTDMNQMLGDPLAFYEEFVLEDEEKKDAVARAAQKKTARDASRAKARADAEFSNKRKCIEFEQEERDKQSKTSELTTTVTKPATLMNTEIGPGWYVAVKSDLTPGKCSHGGNGFVTRVDGEGFKRTFTIEYDRSSPDGGKVESAIPYGRLTELPNPFQESNTDRERKAPENFSKENVPPQPAAKPALTAIHAILTDGNSRRRGPGWRAKDLGVFEDGSRTERFQALLREDVKELKGYLVRTSNTHDKRGRDGVFEGRKATFNPVTMRYIAHAWGVGRNYPKALLNKQQSAPKPKTISPGSLCVIDSLEAAKVRYSAKALFILSRIRERSVHEGIFA
jgi:hypothetical protein